MRVLTSRLRPNQERGAIAIVVAVLFSSMVLLGAAALTIDVGRISAERRTLQNGADAVALSAAKDCATTNCLADTMNQQLADANAKDGFTKIGRADGASPAICGVGPGLSPCLPLENHLRDCVEPASGMPSNWVRAYTTTQNSADSSDTILPFAFAQALTSGGPDGHQVQACAQAGLMPGFPGKVAPVVQAQCAWDYATANGTSFPAKPPYPTATLPAIDQITMIRLHTGGSSDGTKCSAAGPGHYAPGSFGWLDAEDDCEETLVSDVGTVPGKPGAATPGGCSFDDIAAWQDQVLYIPIFYKSEGSGSGTDYYINGVSAFYVAGIHVNSVDEHGIWNPKDPALGGDTPHACYKSANWLNPETGKTEKIGDCLWGWFLDPIIPAGSLSGGTPRGLTTVGLLG